MAGGMGRRRGGVPLGERARAGNGNEGGELPRHCLVVQLGAVDGPRPGVLLEWRRAERGWQGRVAYGVRRAGGVQLVEEWLDADELRPG